MGRSGCKLLILMGLCLLCVRTPAVSQISMPTSPPDVSMPDMPTGRVDMAEWGQRFDEFLISLDPVTLVLLTAGGMGCLLFGRRVFPVMVIANAMVSAFVGGQQLGQIIGYPLVTAVVAAIIAGLLAWPLFKMAVFLTAGACGAVIGTLTAVLIVQHLGSAPPWALLGTAVGFLVVGGITLWAIKPLLIAITSIQGSAMIMIAVLAAVPRLAWAPSALHAQSVQLALFVILVLAGLSFQSINSCKSSNNKE